MVDSNIILYPQLAEVRAAVAKLRAELSLLVMERDELLLVECKNIEAAYLLAVGGLEYQQYELECRLLRLKRKLALIQARQNRQEPVRLAEIEAQLEREFAAYQERLEEALGRMNSALERTQAEFLSDAETAELKKLYHQIVKALHPDLNPEQTEEQARLFLHAVEAYENGDLAGLRLIGELSGSGEAPAFQPVQLVREQERLTGLIQGLRERIAAIKSQYPYTMKALVADEEQVAALRAELEEQIRQLAEQAAFYEAKIAERLR